MKFSVQQNTNKVQLLWRKYPQLRVFSPHLGSTTATTLVELVHSFKPVSSIFKIYWGWIPSFRFIFHCFSQQIIKFLDNRIFRVFLPWRENTYLKQHGIWVITKITYREIYLILILRLFPLWLQQNLYSTMFCISYNSSAVLLLFSLTANKKTILFKLWLLNRSIKPGNEKKKMENHYRAIVISFS